MKKIHPERLQLLNTGHVESRNLIEFLVLDPVRSRAHIKK